MNRMNNIMEALASFSLFPFGYNNSNFESKLVKYQYSDQNTDKENLYKDWVSIGKDIQKAIDKIKNEQIK